MVDTIVRIVVVYLFVMVVFRCIGKRELGSMSPFELVTLMLIPEIVSAALVSQASLTNALSGVSTLFLLVFVSSLLAHRFPRIERMTRASPTVLVANGALCEDAMNRERITPSDIFAEMHRSGVETLAKVRWAILEGEGAISIIAVEDDAKGQAGSG